MSELVLDFNKADVQINALIRSATIGDNLTICGVSKDNIEKIVSWLYVMQGLLKTAVVNELLDMDLEAEVFTKLIGELSVTNPKRTANVLFLRDDISIDEIVRIFFEEPISKQLVSKIAYKYIAEDSFVEALTQRLIQEAKSVHRRNYQIAATVYVEAAKSANTNQMISVENLAKMISAGSVISCNVVSQRSEILDSQVILLDKMRVSGASFEWMLKAAGSIIIHDSIDKYKIRQKLSGAGKNLPFSEYVKAVESLSDDQKLRVADALLAESELIGDFTVNPQIIVTGLLAAQMASGWLTGSIQSRVNAALEKLSSFGAINVGGEVVTQETLGF